MSKKVNFIFHIFSLFSLLFSNSHKLPKYLYNDWKSTVRVISNYGSGYEAVCHGEVVSSTKNKVFVITAAHCFPQKEIIELYNKKNKYITKRIKNIQIFARGRNYTSCKLLSRNKYIDTAFLSCNYKNFIYHIKYAKNYYFGEKIFSFKYPISFYKEISNGIIIKRDINSSVIGPNNKIIIIKKEIKCQMSDRSGMSGTGVFNMNGNLIGIVSLGISEFQITYFVPFVYLKKGSKKLKYIPLDN
jgi:hypothetical protein